MPGGELLQFGELGDRDRGDDQDDDQDQRGGAGSAAASWSSGRPGKLPATWRQNYLPRRHRRDSRSTRSSPTTNWGALAALLGRADGDRHGDRALGADRDRRQPRRRQANSAHAALALAQLAQEASFLLVPFAIAAGKGASVAESIRRLGLIAFRLSCAEVDGGGHRPLSRLRDRLRPPGRRTRTGRLQRRPRPALDPDRADRDRRADRRGGLLPRHALRRPARAPAVLGGGADQRRDLRRSCM